ncbi:MAG: hypothetical protein ACPL1G_00055 [Thermodesulfovibrionales bacterium]
MKKGVNVSRRKVLLIVAVAVLSFATAFSIGWASTTVQGQVTLIDACSSLVFIDNVPFSARNLDLTGIDTGDRVIVTYTDTSKGKIAESIKKIK